jgi:hypothetical protein
MCGMKKTTLYLEPELDRAVGRLAASRGTALRAATGQLERPRITAIGVARGPGGVTDNIDRHLAETGFGEA